MHLLRNNRRHRPTLDTVRLKTRLTVEQIARIMTLLERWASVEAHSMLLELEREHPRDEMVQGLLVQSAPLTRDFRCFERAAIRLRHAHPDEPQFTLALASAYMANHRPALALRTYENLPKCRPDLPQSDQVRQEIEALRPLAIESAKANGIDDLDILADHEESQSLAVHALPFWLT